LSQKVLRAKVKRVRMLSNILDQLRPSKLTALLLGLIAIYFLSQKISLHLQRRRFAKEHGCKPIRSSAYNWTFLGLSTIRERLDAAKNKRLLEMAVTKFGENGNTFSIDVIGLPIPGMASRKFFMTCEPENIKTILSLRFKDFGLANRQETLGKLLGKGIFTTDGESWSHSRAMIRPNFARDQVADLAAFEAHIQTLFQILPTDGSTVDLQDLFFKFTIDSATEFLFGESTNTLRATLLSNAGNDSSNITAIGFAESFNKAQQYCATRARIGIPGLGTFFQDKTGPNAIKACWAFVDQFVDSAVTYREKLDLEGQKDSGKYVFLKELAKNTKDKKRLRDELLNVLLAGRDTTASLLSNMWFMIVQRPDIMAKLKDEVDMLGGELPTYEQVRNMRYLKWCMNESLRLHPVVPANGRQALVDTVLPLGGGPEGKDPLFIPAGTLIGYNSYAMHRRTDFFGPDAAEFRPERWEELRPSWEYLPFNGGPRICLGQQYALTEAGYVSIRLLQEYEFECRETGPWRENVTLTCCVDNGTPVALKKRSS
jgi:cytochrome P450